MNMQSILLFPTLAAPRRRIRSLALAASLAAGAGGAIAGCSSSSTPPGSSSAGSPSQRAMKPDTWVGSKSVISPTVYTVTLSSIDVIANFEPNIGSTPNTDTAWTPDQGYVDWAQLVVQTARAASDGGPGVPYGNPVPTACVLTPPNQTTITGPLSACEQGGQQNGAFQQGKPLNLQFTMNTASDYVTFAVVLDNIESTSVAGPNSSAQDWMAVGDGLQGLGTAIQIGAQGATAAFGGAVAVVGSILSVTEDLSPDNPTWPTGSQLWEVSCAGGLAGNANAQGQRPDTLFVQLQAPDLAALTDNASSSGTLTLEPTMSYDGCRSDMRLTLTVARQWGIGGTSASSQSSGPAVAVSPAEVDGFVAEPGLGVVDFVNTGSWTSTAAMGPHPYAPPTPVSAAMPIAAVSGQPGYANAYWINEAGELHQSQLAPVDGWSDNYMGVLAGVPHGELAAVARQPSAIDVFWVNGSGAISAIETWGGNGARASVTAQLPAPPTSLSAGAPLATVATTVNSLDVFVIGNDGAVYDESWSGSTLSGSFTVTKIASAGSASPGRSIAAVAPADDMIDVFYVSPSGALQEVSWVSGQGWYSPQQVPGAAPSPTSPLAALARQASILDVVYVAKGNQAMVSEYAAPTYDAPYNKTYWSTPPATAASSASISYDMQLVAKTGYDMTLFLHDTSGTPEAASWTNSSPWALTRMPAEPAPLPAAPVPFTITLGESSLYMTPEEGTVESGLVPISVTGVAGQQLTLSASGLPSGITATFSPVTFTTPGQSTLTLVVNAAPLQTFVLTITGNEPGGWTASASLPVTLGPCVPYANVCSAGACGSQSDGCGQTVNCGGCKSGFVCRSGMCESQTCNTPACQCVAQGGIWSGKQCM